MRCPASFCWKATTYGRSDNDCSTATSTRFLLCARQCDHGQDQDAASRMGCGATRGARRRPVQLRIATGGSRYTWHKATSVEISGTKFPAQTATFADVGVKKKSFCGSIDNDKPCLHVDFGKFGDANVPGIEALIGSRYVTLNNSIQDKSYIKQTLGYRMLGMAGLPNSRCNYARVFVNGTLDRPRGRRRQQPRHLRQRRADHEALHRAQLQRQHEGKSVRDSSITTISSKRGWTSSGWSPSPSSRTRPT